MSSTPLTRPSAAYFEDYNEDAHTTMPETRQSANIGHKRSKPDVAIPRSRPDEASDSGYSSQIGPGTSNESSLESRVDSAQAIEEQAAALRRRAPSPEKAVTHTMKSKNKSGLKGFMSRARGEGKSKQKKPCDCKECTPSLKAKPSAAKAAPATTTAAKVVSAPKVVAKQQPMAPPPRPATTRPMPVPATLPAAQPRPVPVTTQSHRMPRPTSYHAGTMPQYYVRPTLVGESAPTYGRSLQYPAPSYPPPVTSYFPQIHQQPAIQQGAYSLPTSYAAQGRPQLRQLMSEQPQLQRQQQIAMVYATPPIAEHPPTHQAPIYVASGPVIPPVAQRQSVQLEVQTSPIRAEYPQLDEDYYKMPPPRVPIPRPVSFSKQQPAQRPAIRHSHTTSTGYVPLQRVSSKPEQHPQYQKIIGTSQPSSGQSSPRKQSLTQEQPTSSSSQRRPSMTARPSTSSQQRDSGPPYDIDHSIARLSMGSMGSNDSNTKRERRRMSYYGHETPRDLERVAEAYQAEVGRTASVAIPPPPAPLQRTGSTRQSLPLTPDNLKLVRKKTGPQSASTDAGSRVSEEMKSKRSSRISASSGNHRSNNRVSGDLHRSGTSDIKPSSHRGGGGSEKGAADGITMLFDPAQEVNFDLTGTQGRTISLRQSKESAGQMEFSIGGSTNTTRGRDDENGSNHRKKIENKESRGSTNFREKSRHRKSTLYEYVDQNGKVLKEIEMPPADEGRRSASRKPREKNQRLVDEDRTERRSSRSGKSGRSGRK